MQERKLSELSGHTKKVTDAKFLGHQDLMVSTSADKTTRLWAVDSDAYKCKVWVPAWMWRERAGVSLVWTKPPSAGPLILAPPLPTRP